MIKTKSRNDLSALLRKIGSNTPVYELSEADYRFFVILKKAQWIQYLSNYVEALDYENVRDNIVSSTDAARRKAYQTVWTTMYNWMGRESMNNDDL